MDHVQVMKGQCEHNSIHLRLTQTQYELKFMLKKKKYLTKLSFIYVELTGPIKNCQLYLLLTNF